MNGFLEVAGVGPGPHVEVVLDVTALQKEILFDGETREAVQLAAVRTARTIG